MNQVGVVNNCLQSIVSSSISILERVGVNPWLLLRVNSPLRIGGNALSTIQIRNASTTQKQKQVNNDYDNIYYNGSTYYLVHLDSVAHSAVSTIFVLLFIWRASVIFKAYVYHKEGRDIIISFSIIPEDLYNARGRECTSYIILSSSTDLTCCPENEKAPARVTVTERRSPTRISLITGAEKACMSSIIKRTPSQTKMKNLQLCYGYGYGYGFLNKPTAFITGLGKSNQCLFVEKLVGSGTSWKNPMSNEGRLDCQLSLIVERYRIPLMYHICWECARAQQGCYFNNWLDKPDGRLLYCVCEQPQPKLFIATNCPLEGVNGPPKHINTMKNLIQIAPLFYLSTNMIRNKFPYLKVSRVMSHNASTKAGFEYNFDPLNQVASDLKASKARLVQRVRSHFEPNAIPLPSHLPKNFRPLESVTPPTGYELLCPRSASYYHIDKPLDITEQELSNKLSEFLRCLGADKNYIVHLIAHYTPKEIGFRTVMKSFFLSSKVPLDALQSVIVNALTAQLEKYQAEELIRLTLRCKESYMMKERGSISSILELSDNIIRKYGYDWSTRLKDPSLYPTTHMLRLEELMTLANETSSFAEQYKLFKEMRKIKRELEQRFNPDNKSPVDLILEQISAHPVDDHRDDQLMAAIQDMKEEYARTNLETARMVSFLQEQNLKLSNQLKKAEELKAKELKAKELELKRKNEELKKKQSESKENINLLMGGGRLKGRPPMTDRDIEMVEYGKTEAQKLIPAISPPAVDQTAIEIAKINAEALVRRSESEAEARLAEAEVMRKAIEAGLAPFIGSSFDSALSKEAGPITADSTDLQLKIELAKAETARTEAETARTEAEAFKLREIRLAEEAKVRFADLTSSKELKSRMSSDTYQMMIDLSNVGKSRKYTISANPWYPFKLNNYAPGTFEFKWGKQTLVYVIEIKKWLVLDSNGLPMLTFQDFPTYRVIDGIYYLYFESLRVYKHFKPLPTFKCSKAHSPPAPDSFGVWDTESYHDIHGPVDTLGLQTLAFKFPESDARTFYLSDYASVDRMCSDFWQTLAAESKGRVVYAHNAPFDYAFTLDSLQDTFGKDNVVILRHKNKIKAIEVLLDGKPVLKLHDSAALFYQAGLRDLCNTYNVENKKTYFPYNFATLDRLNYVGPIPPYELWSNNHNPDNNCPKEVWDQLPQANWNLREELVTYMVQDLVALEQVLSQHAKYIWENFNLNLHELLTAPGMSKYLMFQEQFYYKETDKKEVTRKNEVILQNGKVGVPGPLSRIVKIPGNHECEEFIREGYRGGINEIFETEMMKGLSHDANSMYPFGMKGPMPIGQPIMTKDIDIFSLRSQKYLYFMKAVVYVPEQMYPPLYIPLNGILTAPVGEFEWKGYSPELVNAVDKFGCEIREIIMSVRFDRCDDLFHKFIDTVYKIKCQQDEYKKTEDPRYSPALRDLTKLLLNSGYGGFGMKDLVSQTRIVSPEEADRISELFPIEVIKDFNNGNILIGYKQVPNADILANIDESILSSEELKILKDGIFGRTKVNIAIAAAVTSNARVNLLNTGLAIREAGGKLYKCATDSWYHDGDMPPHLVDTAGTLGLWKKEHDIDYGIFTGGNIYMLNPGQGKKEVRKIGSLHKDFKFDVTLSDLQNMLLGQPMEKKTMHWSRQLFGDPTAAVTIRESSIRLLPAVKKRVPIYENDKWIGGAPIKLNGTERVVYDHMAVWNNRYAPQPGMPLHSQSVGFIPNVPVPSYVDLLSPITF